MLFSAGRVGFSWSPWIIGLVRYDLDYNELTIPIQGSQFLVPCGTKVLMTSVMSMGQYRTSTTRDGLHYYHYASVFQIPVFSKLVVMSFICCASVP